MKNILSILIFIILFMISSIIPFHKLENEKIIKVSETSYMYSLPANSDDFELTLGSSDDNDIVLNLPKISDHHLAITSSDYENFSFKNLSSTNRVAIKSKYLSNYKLKDGDKINLNSNLIDFSDHKFFKILSYNNNEKKHILWSALPFTFYPPKKYNSPQKTIYYVTSNLIILPKKIQRFIPFGILLILAIGIFSSPYKKYLNDFSSYIIRISSNAVEVNRKLWFIFPKLIIFFCIILALIFLSMFFSYQTLTLFRLILVFLILLITIYLYILHNYALTGEIVNINLGLNIRVFAFFFSQLFYILTLPFRIGTSSVKNKLLSKVLSQINNLVITLIYLLCIYLTINWLSLKFTKTELIRNISLGNSLDIIISLIFIHIAAIHLILIFLSDKSKIEEVSLGNTKEKTSENKIWKMMLKVVIVGIWQKKMVLFRVTFLLTIIALFISSYRTDVTLSIINYSPKAKHNLQVKSKEEDNFISLYELQEKRIFNDRPYFRIGYSDFDISREDSLLVITNTKNENRKYYSQDDFTNNNEITSSEHSSSNIKIIYSKAVNIRHKILKITGIFSFIALLVIFLIHYLRIERQISTFLLILLLLCYQGLLNLTIMSFYSVRLHYLQNELIKSLIWGFIISLGTAFIVGYLFKVFYYKAEDPFKKGFFGLLNSTLNTEDRKNKYNIFPHIFFYSLLLFFFQKMRGNELGILMVGGYLPIFELIKLIFVIMATYIYSKNSSLSRYWGWILCFVLAVSFAFFLDDQSYMIIFSISFIIVYLRENNRHLSSLALLILIFICYITYFNFASGTYLHQRFFMCRYPWTILNEQFYLSSHFLNSNISSISLLDNVPQIKDDFSLSFFFFIYKSWGILWLASIIFWLFFNSIRKSDRIKCRYPEITLIKKTYNNIILAITGLIISHFLITIGNVAGTSPIVGIPACLLSHAKFSNILFVIPAFTILIISSYSLTKIEREYNNL